MFAPIGRFFHRSLNRSHQSLIRPTRFSLERFEDRIAPASFTWEGSISTNWRDMANWLGDVQGHQGNYPGAKAVDRDIVTFNHLAERDCVLPNSGVLEDIGGVRVYQVTLSSFLIAATYNRFITLNEATKVTGNGPERGSFIMESGTLEIFQAGAFDPPMELIFSATDALWKGGSLNNRVAKSDGSIEVTNGSNFNVVNNAKDLGANLIIRTGAYANLATTGTNGRQMTANLKLWNGVSVAVVTGGVLSLNQKENSATAGGIVKDGSSGRSEIRNWGLINRAVKDELDSATNMVHLKIEPKVTNEAATSRLTMEDLSSLEFVNDFIQDAAGSFTGTKARIKLPPMSKFKASAGTVDLLGDGIGFAGQFQGDVEMGAAFNIGVNSPEKATIAGSYMQTPTGSLAIDLTTNGYDQLILTGGASMVSLAGALNVSLEAGYAPAIGTVFTIIPNNTSSMVMGYFSGLPNDARFTVNGTKFKINYGRPAPADFNDVTLTVVDDPPDAIDDAATTAEDIAVLVSVLANDTDPENDVLSIASVTSPMSGSAAIVGTAIRYTPNANFNGSDYFSYTISDGQGGTDTAFVSVTVIPVNDPPVAVDDTAVAAPNYSTPLIPTTIGVLFNDSDVDGDTLTVSNITSPPSHGTATISNNSIVYTPALGFAGGTDSLTYEVSDGHGGTATATVTITVTAGTGGGGGGGGGSTGAGVISGLIFYDQNHNGVQDSNEFYSGPAIQVNLLNSSGVAVATMWTTGLYSFTGIAAGQYRIQVVQPAGYAFAPPDQGSDDLDSDVDANGYSGYFAFDGTNSLDYDAGIYQM